MASDKRNHAARRKEESMKAIRARMIAYGHHEQAVEILKVLQDENIYMDSNTISRKSKALDGHIKMLQMIVPKPVELSQDKENPLFDMSQNDRYSEYRRLVEAVRGRSDFGNTDSSGAEKTH